MVERAVLTKEVVDQADAPASGERWIADTKTSGFGLRVWRNRSGHIGKAFCVRIRDHEGRLQRRSFDAWRDMDWYYFRQFYFDQTSTIGDLAEFARKWAVDEIDALKGRPTLAQEIETNRVAFGEKLGRTPLNRAMNAYLAGRRAEGLTEAYVDRLDKLFSRFVPTHIGQLPIAEVTEDMLRNVLEAPTLSPGNLRILRPLLKDLFGRYRNMHWGRNAAVDAARSLNSRDSSDWPIPVETLPNWNKAQFDALFGWLAGRQHHWQQALCLSLFLRIYNAPLTKTMAATWDQFHTVRVSKSFFGGGGKEDLPGWYWDERPWRSHIFRANDSALFGELLRRRTSSSLFLFPSPFGRSVGHIRSIDHVWRETIAEFGLPYTSPRQFRSHYHALNLAGGWRRKDAFGG